MWNDRRKGSRQGCSCWELASRLGFQTDPRIEVSSSASRGPLALAPPLPCPINLLARHRQPKQGFVARTLPGMPCPIFPTSVGTQPVPGHDSQGHLAWPGCRLLPRLFPSVFFPFLVGPLKSGMLPPSLLCFCNLPERSVLRTGLE